VIVCMQNVKTGKELWLHALSCADGADCADNRCHLFKAFMQHRVSCRVSSRD
jgi:TAZ zinc finger